MAGGLETHYYPVSVIIPNSFALNHWAFPKNYGVLEPRPLATGAWLTPRNTLLPRVTIPDFITVGQAGHR